MKIRPATREETEALCALCLRSKGYWGYDATFMERCRSELVVTAEHVDKGLAFVATLEDVEQVLGLYVLREPGERDAELDMLFVEPAYIGTGVGTALLDHARGESRRRGWSILLIESDPFASSFYERHGAVLIGTSKSPSTGRDLPLYELCL